MSKDEKQQALVEARGHVVAARQRLIAAYRMGAASEQTDDTAISTAIRLSGEALRQIDVALTRKAARVESEARG